MKESLIVYQLLRKKSAIFVSLFFMMTTAEASYVKLAKHAGMSHKEMNEVIKKVVKIESTSGSYKTKNNSSGAYGRYQIMPKTAKAYAKKLHISFSQWKKPANQDKIFEAIMRDNILSLKRNKIKISAFSLYGTHQQGASGFKNIIKNKKLTKRLEKNLRQNLPKKYKHISKANLKKTWMKYWKAKMS